MKKVLFIGTFLSAKRGTKGVIEKLFAGKVHPVYKFYLSSNSPGRVRRLLDYTFSLLGTSRSLVHIDVYSDKAFMFAEYCTRLAKFRRNHVILNLRGGKLNEFTQKNGERVQKLLSKADKVLSPSRFLIKNLKEYRSDIVYQPNPIQSINFPDKERTRIEGAKILWIRSFKEIYNPLAAVDCLVEVKKHHPEASLTMIGPDGGQLQNFKDHAEREGVLDDINIVGKVPNAELIDYCHSHDVFLNTPDYESFGVAVLEAMSSGLPVVSYKVGELPFLYSHGENIQFAEQNAGANLGKAVVELLENEPGYIQMSRAARKLSENFDEEEVIKNWEAHLDY